MLAGSGVGHGHPVPRRSLFLRACACATVTPAHICGMCCSTVRPLLSCSDNQAARNCITKAEAASPTAKNDPYLRLTHANIIMNMLPKGRYSNMKDPEQAKHNEYITKVRVCRTVITQLQQPAVGTAGPQFTAMLTTDREFTQRSSAG